MKDAIPSELGGREGSRIDLEKKVEMLTRKLAEAQKTVDVRTRVLSEALDQQKATSPAWCKSGRMPSWSPVYFLPSLRLTWPSDTGFHRPQFSARSSMPAG